MTSHAAAAQTPLPTGDALGAARARAECAAKPGPQ